MTDEKPTQSWQAQKSAEARHRILQAAIECLNEKGYAASSMQVIGDHAGISRGSMIHHFENRPNLMAAIIDIAHRKRLELFVVRVAQLTDEERTSGDPTTQYFWDAQNAPEMRAYLQLVAACQTDPDLKAAFVPRARQAHADWREAVKTALPEWEGRYDALFIGLDLLMAASQGLIQNEEIWQPVPGDKSYIEQMLGVLNMLGQMTRGSGNSDNSKADT